MLFNYTFSKFIDNVDPLSDFGGTPGVGYEDYYNRSLDRAISPNDITHNSTFSAVYKLPWGPKRRWLQRGLAGQVLGPRRMATFGADIAAQRSGSSSAPPRARSAAPPAQPSPILR